MESVYVYFCRYLSLARTFSRSRSFPPFSLLFLSHFSLSLSLSLSLCVCVCMCVCVCVCAGGWCVQMTLDMVHVDLSQVFADGHAYVALSRARNVAGLYVQSFHPTRVHADQRVIQFHAQVWSVMNWWGGVLYS